MKSPQPDASFGFKATTLVVICIAWPTLSLCTEPASPEINVNGHFNRAASGFHGEGCACGALCTNECRP